MLVSLRSLCCRALIHWYMASSAGVLSHSHLLSSFGCCVLSVCSCSYASFTCVLAVCVCVGGWVFVWVQFLIGAANAGIFFSCIYFGNVNVTFIQLTLQWFLLLHQQSHRLRLSRLWR